MECDSGVERDDVVEDRLPEERDQVAAHREQDEGKVKRHSRRRRPAYYNPPFRNSANPAVLSSERVNYIININVNVIMIIY